MSRIHNICIRNERDVVQVCEWESVLSKSMVWMDQLQLRLPTGTAADTTELPLRQVNSRFYHQLQLRLPAGTAAGGTTELPLRQVNSKFYLY
jgi:hypothetical protein